VTFGLHTGQLWRHRPDRSGRPVRSSHPAGVVEVRIGSSSQHLPLAGRFEIVGL
jgi:hypothetical protein